jgi:hypothetical protein
MDKVLFDDESKKYAAHEPGQNKEEDPQGESDKKNSSSLFPMDKLKNGASTAGKLFGSTMSKVREKSAAGWEQAKQTKAGGALASGLNTASSKASETVGKIKETEAFKTTSVVAGSALGKAMAGAAAVGEKAKQGASAGAEMVRSKVSKGGDDK